MQRLRLETALGAMKIVLRMNSIDAAYAMGSNESDWKLMTGSEPWLAEDKYRITKLLGDLCRQMITKMGLPEINLSGEYIAANVALFVHPVNYFAACSWLGRFSSNQELGNYQGREESLDGFETVTPSQIFAMVIEIVSDNAIDELTRNFRDKCTKELGYYEEKIEVKGKTGTSQEKGQSKS